MEYKVLREKYEMAIKCQYEAESYATKVYFTTKRLIFFIKYIVDGEHFLHTRWNKVIEMQKWVYSL